MVTKAFLAMVLTPAGAWESTASVCIGNEAEYRAKALAKRKFLTEMLPHFMKTGLDNLCDSYWRAAQVNGCSLLVREIEVERASRSQEADRG